MRPSPFPRQPGRAPSAREGGGADVRARSARVLRVVSPWLVARRYPLAAGAIILGAVALRMALAAAGWPGSDSDDATMGLMALHILRRGDFPIFFYGQAYMGAIEAYLAAPVFALLGVSVFALKCALALLYAGFMAVMYPLLSGIFDRRWALVGLLLLALGTPGMLYLQLNAYGGYLETLFFGALMAPLAWELARGAGDPALARRRPWTFAGWGLAAGLGLYSDPLVAPFVALSAALVAWACWREARGRLGALALAVLLLGLSPWMVYIATSGSADAARSFLRQTPTTKTVSPAPGAPAGPGIGQVALVRALGVVVASVPDKTGGAALCPPGTGDAWPPDRWTTPGARGCAAIRGAWGVGYLALLGLACSFEAGALWALRRARPGDWPPEDRRRAARAGARLVAMGAPALTILLYGLSSAAASAPAIYSRYIIGVLIATPVMLASLWERAPALGRLTPQGARIGVAGLAALLALALALGAIETFRQIPEQQARDRAQDDLIRRLIQRGDTRVHSEFWTCYRTIFQADERVICDVYNDDLSPRPSRYAPYDALMRAAPNPAWVFPLPSPQADAFRRLAAERGWRFDTETIDGQFVVFRVR